MVCFCPNGSRWIGWILGFVLFLAKYQKTNDVAKIIVQQGLEA